MKHDDEQHSAMGGDAADQLRAYVRQLEELNLQIEGLNKAKAGVYAEAAACGLCKDTLRNLVANRNKKTELLDIYGAVVDAVPKSK